MIEIRLKNRDPRHLVWHGDYVTRIHCWRCAYKIYNVGWLPSNLASAIPVIVQKQNLSTFFWMTTSFLNTFFTFWRQITVIMTLSVSFMSKFPRLNFNTKLHLDFFQLYYLEPSLQLKAPWKQRQTFGKYLQTGVKLSSGLNGLMPSNAPESVWSGQIARNVDHLDTNWYKCPRCIRRQRN